MPRMLPEGALIKVEFELRLPVEASEHDIEEWLLRLHYGATKLLRIGRN